MTCQTCRTLRKIRDELNEQNTSLEARNAQLESHAKIHKTEYGRLKKWASDWVGYKKAFEQRINQLVKENARFEMREDVWRWEKDQADKKIGELEDRIRDLEYENYCLSRDHRRIPY